MFGMFTCTSCYSMKFNVCILIIILLTACTPKDNREGTYTADGDYITFSDSTSGWTTRYPKSWPALTAKEIAAMEGRGEEMLEEAAGGELLLTHRNLLWLKKDNFNSMTSNYQAFDPEVDGPYGESEKMLTDVLETAYNQQGVPFESKTGLTTIDGLEFTTWEATIFGPDRSDKLMTQIMYLRLVNNKTAVTLNINYGNKADRDTLLAIINSSKFSIRN